MGDVKYSVETFDNSEIIIREFLGEIGVKDIISSFKYISENLLSDRTIGIITDIRKARLKMVIPERAKLVSFLLRNKKLRKLKLAVIVDSPENTIIPMLIKRKLPFVNIKAFSGNDAALQWILKNKI